MGISAPPMPASPSVQTPQFNQFRTTTPPPTPNATGANQQQPPPSPKTPQLIRTASPRTSQNFNNMHMHSQQQQLQQQQRAQNVLTGDPRAQSLDRVSAITVRGSNNSVPGQHPPNVMYIKNPFRHSSSQDPTNNGRVSPHLNAQPSNAAPGYSYREETSLGAIDSSQLAASMSINYDTDSEVCRMLCVCVCVPV